MPRLRSTRARLLAPGDRLGSAARRPRALRARALRASAARPRRSATPPITRRCTRAAPTRRARRARAPAARAAARARRARPDALRPRARARRPRARGRRRRRQAGRADARRGPRRPRDRPLARRLRGGARERGRGRRASASTRPSSSRRARTRWSSGTRSSTSTTRPRRWSGSAAGCAPAGRWWSRSRTWLGPGPDRRRSLVSSGRAPPPHPPHRRPAPSALLERTGFRPDAVRHLLVEQNPLGMWQTLLNRLTRERDFAFRLLKRDLGEAGTRAPRTRPRGDRGRRARCWRRSRCWPSSPPGSPAAAARSSSRPGPPMSARRAATVIVPTLGGERLGRMLRSVADGDDADDRGRQRLAATASPGRATGSRGSRSCGWSETSATRGPSTSAPRRADGELVVLLNDDCVCDPGFVERITAPIDPAAGVVMAAGVMRDWRDPIADRQRRDGARPHAARLRLPERRAALAPERRRRRPDRALGRRGGVRPRDLPARSAASTSGCSPTGRTSTWSCACAGSGLRCALAPDALGDHEHSATLGSGSARKNYLMGYGRGYVLRKWQVLNARRLGPVLVREAVLCAGQAVVDRNVAGVRGRLAAIAAAVELERYPDGIGLEHGPGAAETLRRRARRRSRLRSRPGRRAACARSPSSTSPTPAGRRARWRPSSPGSATRATLDVVIPGPGQRRARCSARRAG